MQKRRKKERRRKRLIEAMEAEKIKSQMLLYRGRSRQTGHLAGGRLREGHLSQLFLEDQHQHCQVKCMNELNKSNIQDSTFFFCFISMHIK